MKKTFLFLLTLLLLLFPAGAGAWETTSDITFKLVNEKGEPQPVAIYFSEYPGDISPGADTDRGLGFVKIQEPLVGSSLYVTRSHTSRPNPRPPEGLGFRYTVPKNPPPVVQWTVPSIKPAFPVRPTTDLNRAMVGYINDHRAANGYPRIPRLENLDQVASVWAQEQNSTGKLDSYTHHLLWNWQLEGDVSMQWSAFVDSQGSFLSRFNSPCTPVNGFRLDKCGDMFLSPHHKFLAVGISYDMWGGRQAWFFGLTKCLYNCSEGQDLGDSSLMPLLDANIDIGPNPFCPECSGGGDGTSWRNPELQRFPFAGNRVLQKSKRRFLARVRTHTEARGRAIIVLRHKNHKLRVVGKRTSYGFRFALKKKQLSKKKISPRKARILVRFQGWGNWRSAALPLRR